MELEKQVCSLEIAKKLKELGVKQESLFYWTELFDGDEWATGGNEPRIFDEAMTPTGFIQSSAFTVAELLELLGKNFGVLERFPHSEKFGAYIPNDIGTSAIGEKVADVLAELLMQTL